MDPHAYVLAGLFIGSCAIVGAILGLIVGLVPKDGRDG